MVYKEPTPSAHVNAEHHATGALEDCEDVADMIEACLERVTANTPELLTLRYMLRSARAKAWDTLERLGAAEEPGPSWKEVVDHLHTAREHRGYFLACDACTDDADLWGQIIP